MRIYLLLLIFINTIGCYQSKLPSTYDPFYKTIKVRELGNVDDMIQKLYADYEANATTQEAKDQNLIIDYLTDNKIPAMKLESGVYYKIYEHGYGATYFPSKPFSARYTGYFLDGQVFDSNLSAKEPLRQRVGEMIQGWNEALTYTSDGAKLSIFIPSHLAYGETGVKGVIPPNSVLIFDIDL